MVLDSMKKLLEKK